MNCKSICKFFSLILFFVFFTNPLFAVVFEKAKKVSVISTKYFDIIFSNDCLDSALLIADNGDSFFDEANEKLGLLETFRMPVVICPDSDELSVTYTQSPYNRIVIYDALPKIQNAWYGDTLLNQFKREIIRAVALSVRSPAIQVVSNFFSDIIQPAYLVNMPLSFVEGAMSSFNTSEAQKLSDRENLQILTQAKLEGVFPSYLDVSGARDIYPQNAISVAAGSAFASYILQRWGVERYIQLWHEAGEFHLFALNAGIFRNVYRIPLYEAWKDFEDSIPIPKNADSILSLEQKTPMLFPMEQDSLAQFLVYSGSGLIWFDKARSNVMISPNGKTKQILFPATDVTSLAVSRDGEYLAVSYFGEKRRDGLKMHKTRVFHIPSKKFLGNEYPLRTACFVEIAGGRQCIAGLYSYSGQAEIKAFSFSLLSDGAEIFSKPLKNGCAPYGFFSPSPEHLAFLLSENGEQTLVNLNISEDSFSSFGFLLGGVTEIRECLGNILFSYVSDDAGSLLRMGRILFDENANFKSLIIQTSDIFGGIQSPIIFKDMVLYASRSTYGTKIKAIAPAALSFVEVPDAFFAKETECLKIEQIPKKESRIVIGKNGKAKKRAFVNDYEIKSYNPFSYMLHGTKLPFLPVSSFSIDKEYVLSPGLGISFITESDPLESAQAVFSAGTGFFDFSDDDLTFIHDYSLTAYLKTSLLPVDIAAGATWRFNQEGMYTLQVLGGALWKVPLDMSYKHLSFSALGLFSWQTSYTDVQTNETTTLSGWTSPADAYDDTLLSFAVSFNDYRQSGISPYEQLGFEINGKLISDYDGQKVVTRTESWGTVTDPSNMYISFSAGVKIPRLFPWSYWNGAVTGFPITIYTEWYGEQGTTSSTFAEILLFGYETQFGIPLFNVYFTRFGIKAGYQFDLTYDTVTLPLPDIRSFSNYWDALTNAQFGDFVYFKFESVLTPIMGFLTKLQLTLGVQVKYYIRQNTFASSAIFNANF